MANEQVQSIIDKMSFIEVTSAETSKLSVLSYGDSGSGKTWFWLETPDLIWINAERSEITAHSKGLVVPQVRLLPDISDTKENLSKIKQAIEFLRTPDCSIKNVLVDSLSQIAKIIQHDIAMKIGTPEQPDYSGFEFWGMFKKWIVRFINSFIALPQNVYFTAWQKYVENEEGVNKLVPNLDGSERDNLPYYFSEVWHHITKTTTEVEDGQTVNKVSYGIETKPGKLSIAKSRFHVLDAVEWIPEIGGYQQVMDKIFKESVE